MHGSRLTLGVLAALSFGAATASAQISAVSRNSHLHSEYFYFGPFSEVTSSIYDQTFTDWTSSTYGSENVHETTNLSTQSINLAVLCDGGAYSSQMQGYSWTKTSAYTADYIFDLFTPNQFTLETAFSTGLGSGRVTLFDQTQNLQLYTCAPTGTFRNDNFSTGGTLAAGRYRLHVEASGFPAGAGAPGQCYPTVTFTVPAPGSLVLLSGAGLIGLRRRR